MRKRWLRVGALAAALFAINVVTRLVVRLGLDGDQGAQDRASLIMFTVIGLVLAGVAFVRARREPVERWAADVTVAILGAMLLTIFVGPFVSGRGPFSQGAGEFFSQVWLYAAFTGVGTLVGYLVVTALGWDYRSQSLKRFAESRLAKPRRVVRR